MKKLKVYRDSGTGEIYGRQIKVKSKKNEFNAWGCPYVFESAEFNKTWLGIKGPYDLPSPDLWVYAQKKQVSITTSMGPSLCAVLSPKKVKELIKLLQRTVKK
jgi:hypothetical protein